MTMGMIVHLSAKAGKEAEFEANFAKLAEHVRAEEPGNQVYRLLKTRGKPGSYVVVELYDDDAAFSVHLKAPYIVQNQPTMNELIAPGATVEAFDAA
jgi:(4S)-4-hydroxy-5-phosphonooxypentane-2,3-dione isomerase